MLRRTAFDNSVTVSVFTLEEVDLVVLDTTDNDAEEVSFQDGQEVQLDDGTTAYIYHKIQGSPIVFDPHKETYFAWYVI